MFKGEYQNVSLRMRMITPETDKMLFGYLLNYFS